MSDGSETENPAATRRQWVVPTAVLVAVGAAVLGVVQLTQDPEPAGTDEPGAATASPSPLAEAAASPSPSATPSETASPSPSPTPAPEESPAEAAPVGDEPPALAALDGLDAPRVIVRHDNGVWVRLDGAPWRLLGHVDEVDVIADGRWWYDWQGDDRVLWSVDDPAVSCQPPAGFRDPDHYWAAVHEDGLTTVFVTPYEGGDVASVVCEDPDRPTPLTDWEPPRDGGDGQFGPIILYDDGVRLVLEGDAEGNVTVYDSTGERELIGYAISGPYVDAARGLLVHVDIDGGMHFAGGTLVVSDLDGNELRRTDLRGTSTLKGLVDGHAVVMRIEPPEFSTATHHVVVDLMTGEIVADVPASTSIDYVGD